MHRSTLFLLSCAIIGGVTLIAMWPPRAPKPTPAPEAAPSSLVTRPSSLAPPVILSTDPILGDPNAPLTIIEFGDYTCPACADVEEVLTDLRKEYGERLRVIWKDFPILDRLTSSRRLHTAARCAAPQTKFWEYHDALFSEQPREPRDLLALAERLGLDQMAFAACLKGPAATALVDANAAEAQRLGLTAAPTLYVNGVRLTDPPTYGGLRTLLDATKQTP